MPHLEPTYLRYIYDGLIKGSIHTENAAELPDGLIGMYEEAFDERTSVVERQKLLQRFAIWALLKKEVSAAFVAEILGEIEDDIQEFISTYSAWFNSPESGKYQLYHERLKVYLLQRSSELEIHAIHEKLIARLEQGIHEQKADEFELYGLEFLAVHLAVSCYKKRSKKLFDRFTEYALNDSFHNRQIGISSQYEWTFNLLQLAQYATIALRKRNVELINLKIIDVNERIHSSIHHIIQLIREGSYNIALVRINSLACHSENEVKTKLRLVLLILTDICISRKSKDLLDHNFISDVLEIFELESKKYKIDVFDIISPNIYFQILLFLKESSLDYKYLLNAIIFDWGYSGISKIMTSDFIEFFLSTNKQNYVKLEELFHEIREKAYIDNSDENKSSGNSMHQGAIEAIDCMLISILLKLDPQRLEGFIKNSFKEFLDAFSYDWIDLWINRVMCYVQVDSILIFLHEELFSYENQKERFVNMDKVERKLELMSSILLEIHKSKNNSKKQKELLEYSENLLRHYFSQQSSKSELEKKLEFFDLLILLSINKNKDINKLLQPIIELLNHESDYIQLNQIIRSLYFFEYTEQIPKFIQFYTDDKLSNRANELIDEKSFSSEQFEELESIYVGSLIYKLENDLSKNKLSKTSIFFVENLRLFLSNISIQDSESFSKEYTESMYWEICLDLIVKNNLYQYIDLYIDEIQKYSPNLTDHFFYYLVKSPEILNTENHNQTYKINLINLERALLDRDEEKINSLLKLILESNNSKNFESQWNFKDKDIYRFAKLKLEKGEIQHAINCISQIKSSSKYFVELIFDVSLKLFQNKEEIDFAIGIVQNVNYHFEEEEYNGQIYMSHYHPNNFYKYLSLVDKLINRIISCHPLTKMQIKHLLKNAGIIDENNKKTYDSTSFSFTFTKVITDKKSRKFIENLFIFSGIKFSGKIYPNKKPIQFTINKNIPNILNKELSDSEIKTILNGLNEYSNYFLEQDFFPDYNEFFNKIGLSKANLLNPVHKINIIKIKNALVGIGISEYKPIYSFCQMLISDRKQKDRDSSLKTIFPEFEIKSSLSEYLHKIVLLNKLERNESLDDLYHFNFLTENTNRDGLIEELFQKQQFHPRKHLIKLVELDVSVKRKFLVCFFDHISSFYSNEINWKLVYFLCGKDYVLLNHFTIERVQMLLMQGKTSIKMEKLIADKKDYLSGINDLKNLSLSQE
jgi:hypothetical protein